MDCQVCRHEKKWVCGEGWFRQEADRIVTVWSWEFSPVTPRLTSDSVSKSPMCQKRSFLSQATSSAWLLFSLPTQLAAYSLRLTKVNSYPLGHTRYKVCNKAIKCTHYKLKTTQTPMHTCQYTHMPACAYTYSILTHPSGVCRTAQLTHKTQAYRLYGLLVLQFSNPSQGASDNKPPLFGPKSGWISQGLEIWDPSPSFKVSVCKYSAARVKRWADLQKETICVETHPEVHLFTSNIMSGFGHNKRLRGPGLEIRGPRSIICLGLTSHAGLLLRLSTLPPRSEKPKERRKDSMFK